MKTLQITKTVKAELLYQQILQAYPQWAIVNEFGLPDTAFWMDLGGEVPVLSYPDDGDDSTISAIVDAHDPTQISREELLAQKLTNAKTGLCTLPDWATYTPAQARDAIIQNVMNGMDKTTWDTWVDTNLTVANLATLKATAKQLGEQIIMLRDLDAKLAMMITYLRDLND